MKRIASGLLFASLVFLSNPTSVRADSAAQTRNTVGGIVIVIAGGLAAYFYNKNKVTDTFDLCGLMTDYKTSLGYFDFGSLNVGDIIQYDITAGKSKRSAQRVLTVTPTPGVTVANKQDVTSSEDFKFEGDQSAKLTPTDATELQTSISATSRFALSNGEKTSLNDPVGAINSYLTSNPSVINSLNVTNPNLAFAIVSSSTLADMLTFSRHDDSSVQNDTELKQLSGGVKVRLNSSCHGDVRQNGKNGVGALAFYSINALRWIPDNPVVSGTPGGHFVADATVLGNTDPRDYGIIEPLQVR